MSGVVLVKAVRNGVEVLLSFKATTSVIEEERDGTALSARPFDGFLNRHRFKRIVVDNQRRITFLRLVGIHAAVVVLDGLHNRVHLAPAIWPLSVVDDVPNHA